MKTNNVYTDAYISEMKKQFNFRFDEIEVAKWQKVADLENRSLTNLIETVMMQYSANKLPSKKKQTKK